MNLKDIMSKKIIACESTNTIIEISKTMKENDIGFIPIVKNKKIIGVITDRDIVTKIISNNDLNGDITNYMTKDIIDVPINSDLNYVLGIMKKYKVKRVIITDNNKAVGIVSLSDFLNSNIEKEVFKTIKEIFEIGPNIHKYESQIDDFYL